LVYGGWYHSLRDTNRQRRKIGRKKISMGVKFYGKEELLSGLPNSQTPQDQEV